MSYMVNVEISSQLYEDFLEEKNNLESTLSTIEILQDKELLREIDTANKEIERGDCRVMSYKEIDAL